MKKIHLVTSSFPYPPGEQFLVDEITFWGRSSIQLHVLPSRADGQPADLPENVSIELDFLGVNNARIFLMILALPFYRIFYRELFNAFQKDVLGYSTIRAIAVSLARTLLYRAKIVKYVQRHGPIELMYCYWNDAQAYAACLLKRRGLVKKIASRAHGGDLYKDRWPRGYVPLKWQFVQDFDAIYLLSDLAARYAEQTYVFDKERIFVSSLGVLLNGQRSDRSPAGHIQVVSVSFCIGVKRIDRIIDSMAILAQSHRDVRLKWTHIGDGPLMDELHATAERVLGQHKNLAFNFLGRMSNSDVRQFYLRHPCDVFVNTSDSEGVPVAIMEAMSVGVPTVAPDVGGIPELVQNNCGILLPACPAPAEVAHAIWSLYMDANNEAIRQSAVDMIRDRFNAEKNYPAFIKHILSFAD